MWNVAIPQNGATSQPGITLTAKPKGTGLTIWRDILAQHGGQLSLISKPGVGSTFTAILPVAAGRHPPPGGLIRPDGVRAVVDAVCCAVRG